MTQSILYAVVRRALACSVLFASSLALAQPEEPEETTEEPSAAAIPPAEPDAPETPEAETPKAAAEATAAVSVKGGEAAVKADAAPGTPVEYAPGATRCGDGHQGYHPEYKDRSCYPHRMDFGKSLYLYGNLELDVGYASYEFNDTPDQPSAAYEDIRGRLVVGPKLDHQFGKSEYFLSLAGQLVAWVRDVPGDRYQVNVDDVYVQVGNLGDWDLQVGRFMTWRVYHKGLGFDLYTIEDQGVPREPSGGLLGTHTYEVSYIFYRRNPEPDPTLVADEDAGRVAIHYYPAKILGFELAAPWGVAERGTYNTLGARLAGDLHMRAGPVLLRVSAAGEYRRQARARRFLGFNDETQDYDIECLDCGVQVNKGGGGGAIVKVSIVEAGGGFAKGWDLRHQPTAGAGDPQHSARAPELTGERMSYGGYLQLDPGMLAFKRSLILGVGYQYAEQLLENRFFQEHVIGAAYVAFPLDFNDAMVKLVLSRGDLDLYIPQGSQYRLIQNSMMVGRLRFKIDF